MKNDKAYCFPCKLFSNKNISLAKSGLNDWRHLSKLLSDHEISTPHKKCMLDWLEAENRIKCSTTINDAQMQLINNEVL